MVWLSGWLYRKSHVIQQQAGAGVNYQIPVKVYKGSGSDGNESWHGQTVGKVYCNNHCRNDFGDIRFTTSDGSTLLDYWMQELSAGNYALFWVEVNGDLTAGNVTIYIYYDNATAITTSNIKNTAIQGDHFDDGVIDTTDLWTISGTGTAIESGTTVKLKTTASWGWKRLIDKTQRDKDAKAFEGRMKVIANGGESCGCQPLVFAIAGPTCYEEFFLISSGDGKVRIGLRQPSCVVWLSQTAGGNELAFYSGQTRFAQKITISDKDICRVDFKVKKVGNPTGTISCRIRKTSDDSIIATSPTTYNAGDLTTSYAWKSFTFPNVNVNEEAYVSLEAPSEDASNHFRALSNNGNVCAGVLSIYTGSWTDYATYDMTIKIYEIGCSWVYPAWTGSVVRSTGTWYRYRLFYKEGKFRAIIYTDAWGSPEDTGWLDLCDCGVGDFYFGGGGNNDEGETDYYFMRKYVDPEPTHGSWGSEETPEEPEPEVSEKQHITDAIKEWTYDYIFKHVPSEKINADITYGFGETKKIQGKHSILFIETSKVLGKLCKPFMETKPIIQRVLLIKFNEVCPIIGNCIKNFRETQSVLGVVFEWFINGEKVYGETKSVEKDIREIIEKDEEYEKIFEEIEEIEND